MVLRSAIAIRHVAFEDLGVFEPVLDARGVSVRYVEAGLDVCRLRADIQCSGPPVARAGVEANSLWLDGLGSSS